MKRTLLPIILIIVCLSLPCYAKNKKQEEELLPSVFITDTTEAESNMQDNPSVLKGYAEYLEAEDEISLTDDTGKFVLNLKTPQKIIPKRLGDESKKINTRKIATYSKFGAEEYQIAPKGKAASVSAKGFTLGTSYDQEVDYAEFEQTTGIYTKYNYKNFGLGTTYKRTIGANAAGYIDSIDIAPELRINKMPTLKEILTQNFTYKTYKAEFVLSVNPFAYMKKDTDRLNVELGAGQTFNERHELTRSRIRFSTKFKL